MTTKGYTLETFMRVYDDTNGCYYEIRADADALGLVELRYAEDGDAQSKSLTAMPPEMARLVAQAMLKIADSIPPEQRI